MSPRAGGEADKFGNRYESAWIARKLLHVLWGRIESVTVEEVGDIGVGSEFTTRADELIEVFQVKRQRGNANH
jgi:hypothetical protein